MDVKSVDQRIRDRARNELDNIISKAARDFIIAIESQGTSNVVVATLINSNEEVKIHDVKTIHKIAAAAKERIGPRFEQKAVDEFIRQVDGFQSNLDELYNEIG